MAVGRAGVGYTATKIGGLSTSGTKDFTVNVSPAAANKYGILAFGFVGDADISNTATYGATWNAVAMTPLLAAPLYAAPHSGHFHVMLMGWIVADPPSGANDVQVSYAGIESNLFASKSLYAAAAVLSSVTPLDLGTIAAAVVSETGVGAVSTSGVTVDSGVPADRVISAHLIKARTFTGFTGTKVAAPAVGGGGQLILGESRGQASTPATATHSSSSAEWAAFGLNLDALPVEDLGFSGAAVVPVASFGADLYRFAAPHPDRDYTVPPAGSADEDLIAGAQVRSASGVMMPVWLKDPDDTLDYTLRWYNHLAADDEITHVEHTSLGSAVRIISEAVDPADPGTTQFWAKGAARGVTHPIRIRWWTKRGRQHDFTVFIAGENN